MTRFLSLSLIAVSIMVSSQSLAIEVKAARLDGAKKNILVDVVHGGGCGDHEYSLQLQGCAESFPVQCHAKLIHTTNDFCEALLSRTAVFNLKEYGLTDSYYERASLKITGDDGSSATVRLP